MRATLLVIALCLVACQKAPASDLQQSVEARWYTEQIRNGVAPADAKATLEQSHQLMRKLASDPEANYKEAQRQKALADIRADQCRREPYLSGC